MQPINLKIKSEISLGFLAATVIAIVTGLWVYVISDNPIKAILSFIIGLCAGIVCFFVLTRQEISFTVKVHNFSAKKVIVILFVLFLLCSFISPVNSVFMANWFNLPLLNWLGFVLSLVFAMFVPGFILLTLIGANRNIPLLVSSILSVLVSMFFTSVFWFITKSLMVSNGLSIELFSLVQFILLILYHLKTRNNCEIKQTRTLKFNVIFPLLAIACIFVSLIVLQEFVYLPFVRGDSWDYVSTSVAITKGAFNLVPAGKFYILNSPNFLETFLSGLVGFSGFPPVNSLLILSLLVSVMVPVAFYSMVVKFTKEVKVGLLSTFLFVVASGFGWIPFVSQKIISGASYSTEGFVYAVENYAPKVLYDITQPQGVLSEGFKTYAFGVLAVIMLLYLFGSDLHLRARIPLIALLVGFAFQYHIEEAIVFSIAFIPVFLIFSQSQKRNIRYNLGGVACGLLLGSLIGLISNHGNAESSVSIGLVTSAAMGLFFILTYSKIGSIGNPLREFLGKHKLAIFLSVLYLVVLSVLVLVYYGYSGMSTSYSVGVVSQGLPFPWYYYPMSLGIVGVLALAGLLMRFEYDPRITSFMLMVFSLIVFGILLSWFNINVFSTGTKEWRVIYRIIPIPASAFAGWALYNLVQLKDKRLINIFLGKRLHKLVVNMRALVPIVLLLVVLLGIPSTVIASEYWMATGLNPNGNIHPDSADLELATFFSNLPLTDRAVVFSGDSNALVRLGGGTTATSSMYPSLTNNTRPETVALLSSDIRYLVLNKASDLAGNFPMLSYLQVVFNNSKFVVYRLPFLQSPVSESTIGYMAPIVYDNSSLLSFTLFSSLNFPYQIVNDDFYNKSTIILPKDLSVIGEGDAGDSIRSVDPSAVLRWVNKGGDLVIFGGNGTFFRNFGISTSVNSNSTVNSVKIGTREFSLNRAVDLSQWSFDPGKVKILSYYQFDGDNVCPFAVELQSGNGSIVYLNVDPLYVTTDRSYDTAFYADTSSIINASLSNLNLNLRKANSDPASISDRWLSKYKSYSENNFSAMGNINIESNISGSYLLTNKIAINSLSFNQVAVKDSSSMLYNITVVGQASVLIHASQLVYSSGEAIIPNYYLFEVSNCSLDIKSVNDGSLKMSTDKGTFEIKEVSFSANNASFITHSPSINVDGTMHFDKVSLPSYGPIWSNDVNLKGATKFNLDYGDANCLFFDNVSYPSWLPPTQETAIIPLKDILLSPLNIIFLLSLVFLYLAYSKRFLKVSQVIA